MSDFTHTPTRQAAQSAFMKAQDAYAATRAATERMLALEARIGQVEAENAELRTWRRSVDRLLAELLADREEGQRPAKRKAA